VALTAARPRLIFPEGFDARWESEMTDKGYLSEVIVQLEDGPRYQVNFIDPVRLRQDLDSETKSERPYYAEPGLIIVPEVTMQAIRRAVDGLWQDDFFDHLKPLP
jgi:hypothetical protein